ncbi:MAG: glutathione S-transferase family protein [Pseudomonadota bacterium]
MTNENTYTTANNPFGEFVFYGWAGSFYASKTRSYLRKAQVPFREIAMGHPHYATVVQPVIERPVVPVIQTVDGVIVQDSNDIADYVTAHNLAGRNLVPVTPVQQITAHILDFMFSEMLARFALFTRWGHYHTQEHFVRDTFGASIVGFGAHADSASRKFVADTVRNSALNILSSFGIEQSTHQLIEQQYRDFLDLLSAHFQVYPYLFGFAESVADCALNGSLYPHLARDPYPGMIMRERAPQVLRYAERMCQHDFDMPEYVDAEPGRFVESDALPETLKAIVSFMAIEYLPELKAAFAVFEDWASQQERVPGTPLLPVKVARSVGRTEFSVRGVKMRCIAQTNTFWSLQRVHDAFDLLPQSDQETVRKAMQSMGASEILNLRPAHRLARHQYAEVWAVPTLNRT